MLSILTSLQCIMQTSLQAFQSLYTSWTSKGS
jgi:hypothetical protein